MVGVGGVMAELMPRLVGWLVGWLAFCCKYWLKREATVSA